MRNDSLELQKLTAAGTDLLARARKCLAEVPNGRIRAIAGKLPAGMAPEGGMVGLVFAGAYSAGKSTILKRLTGMDDIATGAGITTGTTRSLDWNGMLVVDTPGIHTELHPEHDEITYEAIARADLLLFVITTELFDDHLAAHFRELAIDRRKAREMMLVVNKMSMTAGGNTDAARSVIKEDLRRVLAPFSPEELYMSFIDAEYAIVAEEVRGKGDADLAESLDRKSGFAAFTATMNRFVSEKGLGARYTNALYVLEQSILDAQGCEPTGDEDADAVIELLLQRRRILEETQEGITRDGEAEIQKVVSLIAGEGRKVAGLMDGAFDEKEVNAGLAKAQASVDGASEKLGGTLEAVFGRWFKAADERLQLIAEGELAKTLMPRLQMRADKASGKAGAYAKVSGISLDLGTFLLKHSFKGTAVTLAGVFKLNQYSGTNAHVFIKEAAKFIGVKFKPWEAVKLTRVLANVGRGLVIAGAVLSVILAFAEDDSPDADRDREIRRIRGEVTVAFNDSADAVAAHFRKGVEDAVDKTIRPAIAEIDAQLAELNGMKETRSALSASLASLLGETRDLIGRFQAVSP
ncbi:MAG: 50S ribosome-binding GTPase [Deltaproteobacteria bacterium]|nr:50S ribosome-binding GTPase [Deltaproteobacteria bacterium]